MIGRDVVQSAMGFAGAVRQGESLVQLEPVRARGVDV